MCVQLLLFEKFNYVPMTNYLYKLTEHGIEFLNDPGSIGAKSSEGNKAGNKLFHRLSSENSRKTTLMYSRCAVEPHLTL